MTLIEAAKRAQAAWRDPQGMPEMCKAMDALDQAIAEAEIKHEVENADDWSEWVCPDPNGYLMKCCDCGLVHEAQFGVVRYKSENEREDCEKVDDPNLQAVFRMRRSEQWSPDDTAHRAGGLPMEQPEQQEPVAWLTGCPECGMDGGCNCGNSTWQGLTDEEIEDACWTEVDQRLRSFARAIEAKLKEKNT